jgi:uncharacterized repeat protein (TIGR03847 family)
MAIYELDPVDVIAVAAKGEPGHRQFYLLARGGGRTMTLSCEKAQVQALLVRLHQMMESQGIEPAAGKGASAKLEPGEPDWQVGEMGLGYHEARKMFVLVASQGSTEETEEEVASIRFWLSHDQVAAFSGQADKVLNSGRPLCPRCGLPMDPAGHPCPVMNGARPIF